MIGRNREGLGKQAAEKIAAAFSLIGHAEETVDEMSRAIEAAETASLAAGGSWKATLPPSLEAAHQAWLDGAEVPVEQHELPEFMEKPL